MVSQFSFVAGKVCGFTHGSAGVLVTDVEAECGVVDSIVSQDVGLSDKLGYARFVVYDGKAERVHVTGVSNHWPRYVSKTLVNSQSVLPELIATGRACAARIWRCP